MVNPDTAEDPFEFSQEDLEALVEKYNDPSFINDLYPLVLSQCHVCDQETCWRCPRCEHYLCSGCAAWLDELEYPPDGFYDEEEDVVLCCDECNARLEMMVR